MLKELMKMHKREPASIWLSMDYIVFKYILKTAGLDVDNFHWPLSMVGKKLLLGCVPTGFK